eukprot:gene3696-3956_t
MASRGGRGGRGGWRGGRSGAAGRGGLQAPGLKDDEGNLVQPEVNAGPPPLFPALELKQEPPDPSAHDKLLLLRRDDLIRFFKYSPYHIEVTAGSSKRKAKPGQAGGGLEDAEQDRLQKKGWIAQQKPPLTSLLTLHPHHFPEELFTESDKRMAARSTREGDIIFRRTPAAEDGEAAEQLQKRLEKLNKQEELQHKDPTAPAAANRQGTDKEAAAEEDDPNAEDDYYQGEVYDDDEGYDDYDDGGDDGPVY